jgi:hypothetical protein
MRNARFLRLFVFATALLASAGKARAWTDDPIQAGTTTIRAIHINELRTAINNKRIEFLMSPFSFTDGPNVQAGVTPVRALHLTELRTSLNQFLSTYHTQCSTVPAAYNLWTDPVIGAGSVIRSTDVGELRMVFDKIGTAHACCGNCRLPNGTDCSTFAPDDASCGTLTCDGTVPPTHVYYAKNTQRPFNSALTNNDPQCYVRSNVTWNRCSAGACKSTDTACTDSALPIAVGAMSYACNACKVFQASECLSNTTGCTGNAPSGTNPYNLCVAGKCATGGCDGTGSCAYPSDDSNCASETYCSGWYQVGTGG